MSTITDHIQGHRPAENPKPTPVYERNDGKGRVVLSTWTDAETARLFDEIADAAGVTRSTLLREALTDLVAKRTLKAPHGRVPRKGHATQTHRRLSGAALAGTKLVA